MTDLEEFETAKQAADTLGAALLHAAPNALAETLREHTAPGYTFRGVHPFHELEGAQAVADAVWQPLRRAFSGLERREDIRIAGRNQHGPDVWTCAMGHLVGLHDHDWLGIPATRKLTFLPYAEFHRVRDGTVRETALFLDIVRVMQQSGRDPFPHQSGAAVVQPGPRTRDGVLHGPTDPAQGERTRELLDRMVADITSYNAEGSGLPTTEFMERTWHPDMAWYGPGGIGATRTLPRYREQHQLPFREALSDKHFLGHVARVAEGDYSGWFGWPNLHNRNTGGYLGLPETGVLAEMRVVDIYRRDGDRLAENWVFIDLLHYAAQHGVDLLADWQALHSRT